MQELGGRTGLKHDGIESLGGADPLPGDGRSHPPPVGIPGSRLQKPPALPDPGRLEHQQQPVWIERPRLGGEAGTEHRLGRQGEGHHRPGLEEVDCLDGPAQDGGTVLVVDLIARSAGPGQEAGGSIQVRRLEEGMERHPEWGLVSTGQTKCGAGFGVDTVAGRR